MKVFVHPENLSFEAMAMEFFSYLSVRTWDSSSAPRLSNSKYPNSSIYAETATMPRWVR